jgi:hypothetical protein
MHGLRHYQVRLRRSRRTPYVVARRLGAMVVVALLVVGFVHLASGL